MNSFINSTKTIRDGTQFDNWLICVDPDSHHIYTLNIYTNQIHVEYEVDSIYREKARKAISLIENLLKFKTGNQLILTKQIDQYRRRKIPSYLLHKQTTLIATYLCQSNLSLAFSNIHSIKLNVKLNFYEDQLQNIQQDYIIEIDAGLVTGADEVIKNILREIYQKYQVKLRTKNQQNQFILQISGLKEFLAGNYPMLSYDRVRVSLRGMKHLEVILTEMPKQSNSESMFPPIIIRENEQFLPINWKIFLNVPVLLWYSPIPLPKYNNNNNTSLTQQFLPSFKIQYNKNGTQVKQSQQEPNDAVRKHSSTEFLKKSQELQNRQSRYSLERSQKYDVIKQPLNQQVQSSQDSRNLIKNPKHLQFQIQQIQLPSTSHLQNPVEFINYQQKYNQNDQIRDLGTLKDRLNNFNSEPKQKNTVLYSGECDWPFQIRICSLENLIQVFESDRDTLDPKDRATANGMIRPLYITKQTNLEEKINKENHEDEKKKIDKKNIKSQIFLKFIKNYSRETQLEEASICLYKRLAFGGSECGNHISSMQKKYGLDMIPYLISVQASIYHGSNLLSKQSVAETRKVPFSVSPRFYQTLKFAGMRISQLTKESRLCFNIIIYSSQGETQIIGSTQFYIFDESRQFRQSMNQLNIWPFYQIDSRLMCMGQYWGLNDSKLQRPTNLLESKRFVHDKYGHLLVQLDQFNNNMIWSLRDEKQMEELGFNKNLKGPGYNFLNSGNSINAYSGKQIPSHEYTQLGHRSLYDGYQQGLYHQEQQGSTIRIDDQTNNYTSGSINMYGQILNHNNNSSQSNNSSSFRNSSVGSVHQQPTQHSKKQENLQEQLSAHELNTQKIWQTTPKTEDLAMLSTLLKVNPLNTRYFTDQQKFILLICRNHYKTLPHALQIFLMAIEWDDPEEVREAHNMIKIWTPLPPEDALPLLDAPFADELLRLYAVERVSIFSDDELALYMLELTQGLIFEKNLFNPLAEMLLERSLHNLWVVGHELFWLLRSQLHLKPTYERYALMLEQILMLCGEFRDELMKEVLLNNQLNLIAQNVKDKEQNNKTNQQQVLNDHVKTQLNQLVKNLPDVFKEVLDSPGLDQPKLCFALDSRMEGKEFVVSQCKVMNSKKLPLWLVIKSNCETYDKVEEMQISNNFDQPLINLNNSPNSLKKDKKDIKKQIRDDKERQEMHEKQQNNEIQDLPKNIIQIIFKNGDDIRQDMLTLQLIKIMDKIWLEAGYDFRMKPYKVISTQDQVGMIEVVTNSRTTEKIHLEQGLMGAFQSRIIWNYLKKKNTEPESFEIATDNFLRSCAGYCVATYILGIGDRHSGNIMLTDTGHLFHIDFGHFLGNFKKKFGFNRERTKFVLTQEMAFVMGGREGELFKKFQSDCTNAYNMVRKHGNFLINIFMMNLSAGIPELQYAHNIKYLEDMLALNISDQEAIARFKLEIITSLNDTWRNIDNFFHNYKRR